MKKRVMVTIVMALVLWCAAAAQATFSGNRFPTDDEYILVFKRGVTWDQAAAEVKEWGSSYHLATITSREEERYVQRLLHGLRGEFWIGGYQDQNQWRWVTGEPWRYQHWAKREPNDYYGPNSEQHLAIWGRHGRDSWHWNDEGNHRHISGFLAERELHPHDNTPVPIPGAVWLLGSGLAVLAGVRLKWRK